MGLASKQRTPVSLETGVLFPDRGERETEADYLWNDIHRFDVMGCIHGIRSASDVPLFPVWRHAAGVDWPGTDDSRPPASRTLPDRRGLRS